MSLILLAAVLVQPKPVFDFDVRSGAGLRISVSGVPIVTGSGIQYYENGWVKGYYSSNSSDQEIQRLDPDTIRVNYSGYNGIATGQVTYHRESDHLKTHYEMHWGDADPAEIEVNAGLMSAQALQAGTLLADGVATRALTSHAYSGTGDFESRRYSHDSTDYLFDAPIAKIEAKASIPATLFDARGYEQEYPGGKNLWWLGLLKIEVSKEKPVIFDLDWQVGAHPIAEPKSMETPVKVMSSATVITPNGKPESLVPRPKVNQLKYDPALEFTGLYDWPAGRVRFWSEFLAALSRRYEVAAPSPKAVHIKIDGGVSKLGLHPGGYQITIAPGSISVLGEEDEGLHNGLRRLAQLAFVRNGKIMFPTGYLMDSPKITWRGVHLFVGPEARGFQKKLWDRVLLPLGFNKVVLQCERTQWDCLPNLHDAKGYMSKADLGKLFEDYRAVGVEPIPLIQSFGHMEWFFRDGQNLDLAVNPKIPYTIDPRKPKSSEVLQTLWEEAFDLLKPTTLHFGCDEVDMLGFPNDHASLLTDLWAMQMPVLQHIAAKHDAKMMIWGDEGLAPHEAVDATNGESKEVAAKRRAAIPKGTWIGDWHYKADTKAESFLPSLQLWKKEGFTPIASTWFQPDNVRSFELAADVEHTGTLQTTWAGYTSNEQAMEENFGQFSAMVLASEYSWSSRFDSVSKLGFDPSSVFRKLYYGAPRPITPRPGQQIFAGNATGELVDGDMQFKLGEPIALRSLISAPQAPTSTDLVFSAKGSHLALVMDTLDTCDVGDPVADLTITLKGGKTIKQRLNYGRHVRSKEDTDACSRSDTVSGLSVLEIAMPTLSDIQGVKAESLSSTGGLRIHGMIVW